MKTRAERAWPRHAWCAWWLAAIPLGAIAQAIEDSADIAAAAVAFLRAQVPASPGVTLAIEASRIDPRLRLPECAGALQAQLAPGSRPAARTSVVVACHEGAPWRVIVPVTLRSRFEVLVPTAPAARGQALTPADLAVRSVEVDGLAHSYIRAPGEIEGRHLARPAPAGVPLQAAWFAADKVVKRGQQVTLVALAQGIRIRAPGRALSDGAARERIRVQNLSSAKVVEGIVENSGEVRVSP